MKLLILSLYALTSSLSARGAFVPGSSDAASAHPANGSGVWGRTRKSVSLKSNSADSAAEAVTSSSCAGGPVLSASGPDDPTQFDSACAVNPVVLPPSVTGTSKWQCYYYGNAGSWSCGYKNFLPSGWIGLAESDDGVHWTKVTGSEEGGSILAPTGDPDDWDGVQVGLGDVIRVSEDELHMYYFGGDGEEVMPGMKGVAGFRMRIGRARSTDGGRTWERMGLVLEPDEEEGLFASWPRLMIPEEDEDEGENDDESSKKKKPWRMLYHSFDGKRWAAFGASSHDGGQTWTRDGMMLGPGPEGSWDESGVGTRAVLRRPGGEWDMVYEAVDKGGTHRLGVAHLSENDDGTYAWNKAEDPDFEEKGGPMLQSGVEPLGPWTSGVIGTPFLVGMDDGSVRLYFVTKSEETTHAIGLVVSDSGELKPNSWREVSTNN